MSGSSSCSSTITEHRPVIPDTLTQPDSITSIGGKLDSVLQAVKKIGTFLANPRTSLEKKIDIITADLTLLHADHRKLADTFHDTELLLAKLQPKTQALDSVLTSLTDIVCIVERRTECGGPIEKK
ncbi:hypothetical protein NDU88_003598 [Pleurodeles waltl]|uniref:Leptin n=1 Tax=Pleurodeles waltl TaxID=8319 RepID=A0AAV7NJQ9_PLEWA|nr:hypothetical protein NDU88_003598 [Pleurodeles waltl]